MVVRNDCYESIVVERSDNKNGTYQDEKKEDFVTLRFAEGKEILPLSLVLSFARVTICNKHASTPKSEGVN